MWSVEAYRLLAEYDWQAVKSFGRFDKPHIGNQSSGAARELGIVLRRELSYKANPFSILYRPSWAIRGAVSGRSLVEELLWLLCGRRIEWWWSYL